MRQKAPLLLWTRLCLRVFCVLIKVVAVCEWLISSSLQPFSLCDSAEWCYWGIFTHHVTQTSPPCPHFPPPQFPALRHPEWSQTVLCLQTRDKHRHWPHRFSSPWALWQGWARTGRQIMKRPTYSHIYLKTVPELEQLLVYSFDISTHRQQHKGASTVTRTEQSKYI